MDRKWMQLLAAFLMGVMMPVLAMQLGQAVVSAGNAPEQNQSVPSDPTQPQETPPSELVTGQIPVLMGESTLKMMDLDTYLLGVVLAEMPADFGFEALKAQAVAARTFALQCAWEGKRHPGGAVCTNSKCCQAYIEPAAYVAEGGGEKSVDKIRRAVTQTKGQILTYRGQLIQATYFSCSGGQTEDAVAVWGTDVPYLISVSSPGEEDAQIYSETVTFSAEEFARCLGRDLTGSCEKWLGKVTYTRGGGVASMVVAGKTYTGTELRKLLNLNSAAFEMTALDGRITVTTSGKGHRVGMSQYGADAMAKKGCSYDEILNHYYPGTRIDKVDALG